jgi:LPXTG-motif cell wall-anchored protein
VADLEQHPGLEQQTGPGLATGPLDTDERAELERLRQEVAALRTAPPPPPARPPRHFRWASLGSAVLLVLGLLLVPVSVLAVWTNNQVSNTDRFVATVSPVAADPAVQTALADRITTEIFNRLDVQQLANQGVDALAAQGLPPPVVERLHDLTGPVAEGVRNFVRGKVGELVASPGFVAAVNRAVAVAHTQMDAALSGDSAAITVSGGNAVLDLAPFIDAAKQQLVASGFAAAGRIPEVHPTIELFPASTLIRAQTAYRTLDAGATWLPWLTLLMLVGGVLLARRRRRATMAVGIAVMAIMVVVAASLLVVRGLVVGGVPEQGVAAVAAAYDIVIRFLRIALRTLFVVGLVVALAAYLTGPSRGAVAVRRTVSGWIAWLRRGGIADRLQNGPVGPWVHEHRRVLQVAAVILAALVVVFLDRPTGFDILWVVIGLLVVLGVIEFLNQPRESEEPRAGPPQADDSGAAVGGTG